MLLWFFLNKTEIFIGKSEWKEIKKENVNNRQDKEINKKEEK